MLGAARIAREQVIPGIRRSGSGEVVAVSSASGRAGSYAAEVGIPKAYDSHEDLLADADVDAVYIALPNSLHASWIVRAAEAGKHVLCEKPLVVTGEELERVAAAVEAAGVHLAEAFMYRHHPQLATVRELIGAGKIGELVTLDGPAPLLAGPHRGAGHPAAAGHGRRRPPGPRVLPGRPLRWPHGHRSRRRGRRGAPGGRGRHPDGGRAPVRERRGEPGLQLRRPDGEHGHDHRHHRHDHPDRRVPHRPRGRRRHGARHHRRRGPAAPGARRPLRRADPRVRPRGGRPGGPARPTSSTRGAPLAPWPGSRRRPAPPDRRPRPPRHGDDETN